MSASHPLRALTFCRRDLSICSVKTLLTLSAVASLVLTPACREGQAQKPISRADNAVTSSTKTFPALIGRVVDIAQILSPQQESAAAKKLAALERATRHQLVVVTVPTLNGQDIAVFTRDLGRHWGIGRKDYAVGVILLVAPKEQKIRIAVGYGLEKTLTPAVCQQIIDKHIIPRFRQGDFAGGVQAGVDAIVTKLKA